VVEAAAKENGYKVSKEVVQIFDEYRKSHNDGVFDAYTDEMKLLRSTGILNWFARQLCSWENYW
jgi:formate C-acetyltransferase